MGTYCCRKLESVSLEESSVKMWKFLMGNHFQTGDIEVNNPLFDGDKQTSASGGSRAPISED